MSFPARLTRWILLLLGLVVSSALSSGAETTSSAVDQFEAPTGFDAGRLRTGRFVYRNLTEGREIARFVLTVHALPDGSYRFTGDAAGFNQHWESVARASFEPVSAALSMERKTRDLFQMRLTYGEGRVTGETITTAAPKPGSPGMTPERKIIQDYVPVGTVDQRIDWAAVLSSPLVPGQKLNFAVYDPTTGTSPVVAAVMTGTPLRVPAGTFKTVRAIYLIQKTHGTEAYEVWTTPDPPRMLLRESFANGTSTELVETGPAAEANASTQGQPAKRH